MTGDRPLDPAALESLLARLRHRARLQGLRPDLVFHLYVHERFLARLARSAHRDHFVLKGGLNLYSRLRGLARPTVDIDLAGQGLPATPEGVEQAVREVMRIRLDDLVAFDPARLSSAAILEGADHGGVRLEFEARVGRARQRLQLDVSFGNAITPAPVTLEFPSLLDGGGHALLGYPVETILAEKTAAAVELGEITTRQKDFYDLYQLSLLPDLPAVSVRLAFERTFAARRLDLTAGLTALESLAEHVGLTQRWGAYLRRSRLDAPADFAEIMRRVLLLVRPILQGEARGHWQPEQARWDQA